MEDMVMNGGNMDHSMHDHGSHMNHIEGHTNQPEVLAMDNSHLVALVNGINSSVMHHHGDMGSHGSNSAHEVHTSHATESHGSHQGHQMSMTFHGGIIETILFSWWEVSDVGEFVGSFLAIFIMALLYEGLKYYRKHLLWKTYAGLQYCAVAPPDKGVANICADEAQVIQPMAHTLERNVPTMMSKSHLWQTVLHGVQVLVSYMLMLVFMTYNTWLCCAVVLGSATGYFLFGWRESVVVDFTEHCH